MLPQSQSKSNGRRGKIIYYCDDEDRVMERAIEKWTVIEKEANKSGRREIFNWEKEEKRM